MYSPYGFSAFIQPKYKTAAAKIFTIKYNANGGSGSMANQQYTYGVSQKLRKNTFTRSGFKFVGWQLYMHSSKKWMYIKDGTAAWYEKGKQPKGYILNLYHDQQSIAKTTSVDKDTVEMYAVWTPNGNQNINDGRYHIVSAIDNKACVAVKDESTAKGANVVLWSSLNSGSQTWNIKHIGSGYYTITNYKSGMELDVDYSNTESGTNVLQWTTSSKDNHKWVFRKNSDGTYSIISKVGGNFLDATGAKSANGTNIQVYKENTSNAQKWKLVPYKEPCTHSSTELRNYVAATCTSSGYSGDTYCRICGERIKTGSSVAALGHDWGNWTIDKDTSCQAEGRIVCVCKRDPSHKEYETIMKIDHSLTRTAAEPATCESAGNSAYYTCSMCGKYFSDSAGTKEISKNSWILNATGHSWDSGKITKQPKTTAEGIRTYTCSKCGSTRTESIAKLKDNTPSKPSEPAEPSKPTQPAQPSNPVRPAGDISEGASSEEVENILTGRESDSDPAGTTYGKLAARIGSVGKTSQKITWNKVKGAKEYIVYGNKCGKYNRVKKLASTPAASYVHTDLKKGTYYKYVVVAVDGNGTVIASSKMIHSATSGGKVGNIKKVTTNAKKNAVGISKGKTFKLKAKGIAASKKLKVKRHRAIMFESSNKRIATVSSKGVIKGKAKGTCYIYAYGQNGVSTKVKVTVK